MKDNTNRLIHFLNDLDINNIEKVIIRLVGLLDVFGKIIIDISFVEGQSISKEYISPVDINPLKDWLVSNNLLDKTVLYRF